MWKIFMKSEAPGADGKFFWTDLGLSFPTKDEADKAAYAYREDWPNHAYKVRKSVSVRK